MNTTLALPEEMLKEVVSAAILQAITPANKEALLREALRSLLEPKRDGWGGRSPLQEAYAWAVQECAQRIIMEEMQREGSEMRAAIEAVIRKAFEQFTANHMDETAKRMAHALSEGLTKRS